MITSTKPIEYINFAFKIKKVRDPVIEYNLKNNFVNFEVIQQVLYDNIEYYQFIRTDHPEYPKIKEFYEFLIK
jgi:hypothetical protein